MFDSLPGLTYWKNPQGIYLGCNAAFAKFLNLNSSTEIIGKSDTDLFADSEAEKRRHIDHAILQMLTEQTLEETVISADGTEHFFITHKKPIYDENNSLISLLSQSTDISYLRHSINDLTKTTRIAEKTANTANLYLKNILDNIPGHFFWMDAAGRVRGCNERQAKNFGFKKSADLIGKNIYDVAEILGWDKSIADAIRANDLEVMTTGTPREVIEEVGFFDGTARTYLSYKNPLYDENGIIIGIIGIAVDITERKQLEQALQVAKEKAELANIAKTQFIMNISHDIRTPFSGILGLAQLLEKREINPEKKENLGYIVQSSTKLLALINEIIDLVRADNNNDISLTEINLRELAQEVLDIFGIEFRRKQLSTNLFVQEQIPRFIQSDKNILTRILLNLVGNAAKFTKQGQVVIAANLLEINGLKGKLQLIVEDTGIGIPAEKQQDVFHQFTRLTPSYKNQYEGSGIGLWIVKQLLQKLDGEITIESQVGKGSKFICIIPFTVSSKDANVTETTSSTKPSITNKLITRILIVEDNLIAQKTIAALLQEHFNCPVDVAESGEKALELLINHYDLIIMDIGLPGIDGFSTTEKIRQHSTLNKSARIIGLTAHCDSNMLQKAMLSGMNSIFVKPLTIDMCNKLIDV